jgi:hypothetical protein
MKRAATRGNPRASRPSYTRGGKTSSYRIATAKRESSRSIADPFAISAWPLLSKLCPSVRTTKSSPSDLIASKVITPTPKPLSHSSSGVRRRRRSPKWCSLIPGNVSKNISTSRALFCRSTKHDGRLAASLNASGKISNDRGFQTPGSSLRKSLSPCRSMRSV